MYQDEQSYIHNPPTPRSNTASDGIRTRSGRSTAGRRTDSPFSTSKSRVSKSPAPPRKREKKSKVDKSKLPKLTAPLSVLTKDMNIPIKDIGAHVNRSVEDRLKEKEKNNGYITRPMNSFMLYRSAYSERTKAWCSQNNHQIVSSVSGESWPMEPDEIRSQFDEWAKIERQHHQEAHPNYKFSPSKSTNKRRKEEMSEDGEPSDLDGDPDGEYRGGSRNVRERRHDRAEAAYLPSTVGFESHPYYGHQVSGYEQSHYQYANPGRPLPSNVAFDHNGLPYNPQTNTYIQTSMRQQQHQQPQYPTYMHEMPAARVPTPGSLNGGGGAPQQSLGGYGLPGGHQLPTAEELFTSSRTSTPMQHYQQYSQPVYAQYPTQYHQTYQQPTQQYEHAQYLQQQSQPQAAIDPSLEAAMAASVASGGGGQSHFEEALGDFDGLRGFYEGSGTSPVDVNATLAPTWSPGEELG